MHEHGSDHPAAHGACGAVEAGGVLVRLCLMWGGCTEFALLI